MPTDDIVQFDPPAQLAKVTLRNPDSLVIQSDIPMRLDSGADVTLISRTAVAPLKVAAVVRLHLLLC